MCLLIKISYTNICFVWSAAFAPGACITGLDGGSNYGAEPEFSPGAFLLSVRRIDLQLERGA